MVRRCDGVFVVKRIAHPLVSFCLVCGLVRGEETMKDEPVPRDDGHGLVNLALGPKARAAASSVYDDGRMPIHQIRHLNDGRYNNAHSWISASDPSWAEIDLGGDYLIGAVVLGSEHAGRYTDRAATAFDILVSREYDKDTRSPVWQRVYRYEGPPVRRTTAFEFLPVPARWVRVAIRTAEGGQVRIDEIEVYGDPDPTAIRRFAAKFGPYPTVETRTDKPTSVPPSPDPFDRAAAQLEARRLTEAIRNQPKPVLPLPIVRTPPAVDGRFDDACWRQASGGGQLVRSPGSPEGIESVRLMACRDADRIYLAVRYAALLPARPVRIGTAGVVLRPSGLWLDLPDGKRLPVDGALSREWNAAELAIPISSLPGDTTRGLEVAVGIDRPGGESTGPTFEFRSSAMFLRATEAEVSPSTFTAEVGVADGSGEPTVRLEVESMREAGSERSTSVVWQGRLSAERPQPVRLQGHAHGGLLRADLRMRCECGTEFRLPMVRYDPVAVALAEVETAVRRREQAGADVTAQRTRLAAIDQAWRQGPPSGTADGSAWRSALISAARALRRQVLLNHPAMDFESVVFIERHIYHPSHIYTEYSDAPFRPGGGVYVLRLRGDDGHPDVARLFDGSKGTCRDPDVGFDGKEILFSYRDSAGGSYHIYRMNADGSGLKQLTDGPFHDTYPCHLPDGRIAFISTRCASRVLCFSTEAATLFVMNGDGSGIELLSANNVNEWSPAVLPDGRILYTRWEYLDKGADYIQSLWAIHPDGTGSEQVFGNNLAKPYTFISARPVPGDRRIVCTICSHWGDHVGPMVLVDPSRGMNNLAAIENLTPDYPITIGGGPVYGYRDPWPLSADLFMVSHAPEGEFGLFLFERDGAKELLWAEEDISCFQPRPLRSRPKPPVLPSERRPGMPDAVLLLVDVYRGLGPEVERGRVRYLQIAEEVKHDLPRKTDGTYVKHFPDFMAWYASPWEQNKPAPGIAAKRIYGTVPVEPDGSAHFLAPTDKPIFFAVLDENYNELQRMKSYVHLKPGEVRSCIGCHEARREPPPNRDVPRAARRDPDKITPPPWGATRIGYARLVQPVWDNHCLRCHGPTRRDANLDLSSRPMAPGVPVSYKALVSPRPEGKPPLVSFYDNWWGSLHGVPPGKPLAVGTLASPLIKLIDGGHYDVKLTAEERRRITAWIDMNCPLAEEYGHLLQARK